MSNTPCSPMTRSTGLRSQSQLNMSYGSIYSNQYTARMKKIQELREERSRVIEKDICEARVVNGFVFPSTQHMDISRGPRRGFNGFRHQDRSLPPNCITYHSSRSIQQQRPSTSRHSPTSNRSSVAQHISSSPMCQEEYQRDAGSPSYTDAPSQDINRRLYPPSPPSTRTTTQLSPARAATRPLSQSYHLILNVCVQEVSGSMDVLSERFGLLATTRNTNKIELSTAARTQLSLHGQKFTMKILNPVSSGQKAVKFTAQFDSSDPQDFVELYSVLSEKTKIYIQKVVPNKILSGEDNAEDLPAARSNSTGSSAVSPENIRGVHTISDLGSESALG